MKKLIAILCTALMILPAAGCEKKSSDTGSSAGTSQADDEKTNGKAIGIPDDVRKKLDEVLAKEPVPVPENGWTDETLMDVIYVNGEKLTLPYTLSSLGEGFGFIKDSFITKDIGCAANITYFGEECGLCSTSAITDVDNFARQEMVTLSLSNLFNKEGVELLPISVNGVTLGTSYDDMVARLGFTVGEDKDDPHESGRFFITADTETYHIQIVGSNDSIHSITVRMRRNVGNSE